MGRIIPRGAEPRTGRTQAVGHVLLTCALFAAAPAGLFAQGTDAVRTYWVPTRSFNIPFSTGTDPRLVDMLLHVSTDNGQTYRHAASARPSDRRFFFQAQGDGWHFFIVQTRDRDNVLAPSDLRGAAPSIRVCVDTQKPVINLRQIPSQDGYPIAIEWSIQDANFDDLYAEYRSVNGGDWYPLFLPRTASGKHEWTPAVSGDLEVRLQAIDRAKNKAAPLTVTIKPDPRKAALSPVSQASPGDVKHVKNKTFQLDYQLDEGTIGPSDVKGVEIWKMHPGGPWQKCRETGSPKGPATVTVDTSGRWGFRLIPRSGVGLAEPDPRPGEAPDLWVEVDDRAPQVKITNVVVSPGADSGRMTVTWTASDPFLARQAITISYSPLEHEDWKVLEKCDNSGSFSCEPQKIGLPYQFFIKVEAADEAGNVGADRWREPIKVDLKVPRIKRIEVKPGEAREPSSAAPQTQRPYSPLAAPPTKPAGALGGLPPDDWRR